MLFFWKIRGLSLITSYFDTASLLCLYHQSHLFSKPFFCFISSQLRVSGSFSLLYFVLTGSIELHHFCDHLCSRKMYDGRC